MFSILRGYHTLLEFQMNIFVWDLCSQYRRILCQSRQQLLFERYLTVILDTWGRAQLVQEMRHKMEGSGLGYRLGP
jgi:hypothetical protein